jgi:hypothetical protein
MLKDRKLHGIQRSEVNNLSLQHLSAIMNEDASRLWRILNPPIWNVKQGNFTAHAFCAVTNSQSD